MFAKLGSANVGTPINGYLGGSVPIQVTTSLIAQVQNPNEAAHCDKATPASVAGNTDNEGTSCSKCQNADGRKKRVHASSLIERTRFLRTQPTNTSPVDSHAYPSLLPPRGEHMQGAKCLILDVDETLVHSFYQPPSHYDLHMTIEVEPSSFVDVYVAFRPYLREFLDVISSLFEVVIFTASLSIYCTTLMDAIDPDGRLGRLRLFREHCSVTSTTHVKDLSLLGRDLHQVAIIDNSPHAYVFQKRNAIPITSWFGDDHDDGLKRLIPVLVALSEANTVYDVLDSYNALLQLQSHEDDKADLE